MWMFLDSSAPSAREACGDFARKNETLELTLQPKQERQMQSNTHTLILKHIVFAYVLESCEFGAILAQMLWKTCPKPI